MPQKITALTLTCLGLVAADIHAAVPNVAVDIAPVHSLVSQVMDGVGQPDLLVPASASPHEYSLRPSQAKALSEANVVFWVSEALTPWLEKALDNIAHSAQKIELLELKESVTYEYREGATFESHEHHDNEEHGSEEKHDIEEVPHKDEHQQVHEDAHDEVDPHAWLDPQNAKIWLAQIARVLGKNDPENATIYAENAAKATIKLDTLMHTTQSRINAAGKLKFIVFHDAYQYFEKRFGISAAGSISVGDAQDPSPARIKEIQNTVDKLGVTCIFTEPQFNPGLVKNVFEGTKVSTMGVMDPLGSEIKTGSNHYFRLIESMADSLISCQ
ncbi:MAG: zinc transport system substrate-binding protein [Oleiphilaceae bacterium]|jgi:zinc transport system substrate-binding protein